MIDFTIETYIVLLNSLKTGKYQILPFMDYLQSDDNNLISLRHDVDKLPQNSSTFARIQSELGIHGTFFFRVVPESLNPEIITEIAGYGHEIGYHYEDIDIVYKEKGKRKKYSVNDLLDKAIENFAENLKKLRKYYPVKTICMHGSPLSPFDNKALWTKYDYRDFGIIGEPYFDIDFDEVAYYTDTGRRWDGEDVSVRDKVKKAEATTRNPQLVTRNNQQTIFPHYHSTMDIINAINSGTFPSKAMLTFHPQRWTNNPLLWTKELVMQNAKNVVKKYFFVKK